MSVRDDIKKQHKKIQKKGFKASLSYFWDYYKFHTAAVIIGILFLAFLIRDVVLSKPYGFYATLLNETFSADAQKIQDEFAEYAKIDTSKYEVYIDTSMSINMSAPSQFDLANQQKIMAVVASSEMDVLVSDYKMFKTYAENSYMADLSTIMSSDKLEKFKDKIYYIDQAVIDEKDKEKFNTSSESTSTKEQDNISDDDQKFILPDPSNMKKPVPVGIVVDNASYFVKNNTYAATTPIYGIIGNSKNTDKALAFLDFIYDKK